MNDATRRALKSALGDVQNNLYRYRNFAKPHEFVGSPETVEELVLDAFLPFDELVIEALERKERELIAALGEENS